ncbi:protein LURP-one-related 11-like [Pyrus ussuriensis x Pyrus communis]|uniref:Protein LURP-one-related 11-like n=1 Tax=Pyrus ussuriensis x Pyrus communis TaxID=2448454 RepID=A0A5N5HXT0_9ROSA|nr:protein LURP-one-related 11-like [Pyrus ussuriensis x Pyrus communis]
MAKVHPLLTFKSTGDASSSSTSTPNNKYLTSKRETFTIWMKSLVIQGSGCTAFDENREIVYRVNNYDSKHSSEVYLMDLHGKLLYLPYGYKSNGICASKPLFRMRKKAKRKQSSSGVVLGDDVFTLVVEPHVDHSFVMALVTVYGMIRRQI